MIWPDLSHLVFGPRCRPDKSVLTDTRNRGFNIQVEATRSSASVDGRLALEWGHLEVCPCRLPKTNPARVRVIMDPVKGVRTPAKVSVYWIKGAAARHRGEREAVPTVEDARGARGVPATRGSGAVRRR